MSRAADVRDLIADQFGTRAFTYVTRFDGPELGADSLDLVELVVRLENAFGVAISDDEASECQTVGDAIALVDRKLHAGNRA